MLGGVAKRKSSIAALPSVKHYVQVNTAQDDEILIDTDEDSLDALKTAPRPPEKSVFDSVIFYFYIFSFTLFLISISLYLAPHFSKFFQKKSDPDSIDLGSLKNLVEYDSSKPANEIPITSTFSPSIDLISVTQSSASSSNKRMAFVTLAVQEKDFIRSLTLAQMIKNTGSRFKTVIFVHPDANYSNYTDWLNKYDDVLPKVNAEVGYFPSSIDIDLRRPKFKLHKERWKPAWIKLGFFSLYEEYLKMVYMDSDVYVARNVDYLFSLGEVSAFTFGQEKNHEDELSYINSGVCVIVPSPTTATELLRLAQTEKFVGGDQMVYKSLFLQQQTAPFLLLAPVYNLNAALCPHARFVRIYHLYHHKPWRNYTRNREPLEPCEKKVILKWKDAQNKVLEYVHAVGIDTARLQLMCC